MNALCGTKQEGISWSTHTIAQCPAEHRIGNWSASSHAESHGRKSCLPKSKSLQLTSPPSQIKPKVVKKGERGEEGEKFEGDQCVLKNKNKSQAASEIPSVQALDRAGTYFSLCLWSVLHGAHLHGDLLKE